MKELDIELTPKEQRLINEGFRFNKFGELSMPADEFIARWDAQHPLSDSVRDREWWIESKK